jgi:hypothetical protein
MVVKLKSCPRCIGDVFLEHDRVGAEWVCVQCGYRREIHPISRARAGDRARRGGAVPWPRRLMFVSVDRRYSARMRLSSSTGKEVARR